MAYSLLMAIGLIFVLEGILPFLSPPLWRRFICLLLLQPDQRMRLIALSSMLLGLFILSGARYYFVLG